ncbi:hypothetical protein MBLNU230_g2077t1 [Neophaeotheca triangularis]
MPVSNSSASSEDYQKDHAREHLTEHQQDLREAAEPPLTAEEDGPNQLPAESLTTKEAPQEGGDLEKVQSAKPSINNIKSVPNGGLTAWLQVLGSFFLFFNSWGIVNSFGTYQAYYEDGILASSSPSDISWIGSIQSFLLMFVGAITGPIYDAGYVHHLIGAGSFLIVFGQMMLSLCNSYYQVMLAQAISIGLGAGCLFVPAVAILSTYFSTKVATAMGIAAAGSSLGGVIYPIIFYRLQPTIGFPWATRVIGFIALGTLGIANAVMRVRILPASRRKLLDLSAFKEPPYVLFVAGCFLGFMGLYTFFFYIQSYAIQSNIMEPDLAFYLLAILNSLSLFGRIIPGIVADYLGPMNMIVPCCIISGVLMLCTSATSNVGGVVTLCVLFGFFSGTFVSLPPSIYVHLTKNRAVIGTRMGMGFAITSIGLLIGTPIAGAVLDSAGFTETWVYGGVLTVSGGLVIAAARVSKSGFGLMQKV